LIKCEDGQWAILLRFENKDNMEALLESLKTARPESFKPYASMIDFSTMRIEFYNSQL
jgi:hypothetical protein